MNTRWGTVAAAAAAWLLIACGDRLASSEVGNPPRGTVKGMILGEDGKPAPGTRVGLLPAHFDPVRDTAARLYADTTDASGVFLIPNVDSGSYNLQALQLSARTRLLIQGVEVRSDTTVATSKQTLQKPGAISVLLPDSLPTKNGYVYLPGTQIYATTASLKGESRLFVLDSVPAGVSPEILYSSSVKDSITQGKRILLSEGVQVSPGDTVPASAFQEWAHSARVFLNTTASGANVTTNPVRNFPLLVRLGPGASVFASATNDGHDLRFALPDGTPLPFEIESWDKSASQALVWVRVPIVNVDDSTQFIRMYWGNSSATPVAGSPVFDSADGYASVWHMEALQSGSPAFFKDYSQAGNSLAAGGGLGDSALTATPLGTGVDLDGQARTLTTAHGFVPPNTFSLALWFKTSSDSGGKLMGFGADPGIIDTSRDRHLWIDTNGLVHFGVLPQAGPKSGSKVILSSTQKLNDGQWHMAGGVLWSGGMVLYIDGEKIAEDASVTSGQVYAKNVGYWKVGFDFKLYDWTYTPNAMYYKGALDEVRVLLAPVSKEWYKLSYENQRADSRFLRFGNP